MTFNPYSSAKPKVRVIGKATITVKLWPKPKESK